MYQLQLVTGKDVGVVVRLQTRRAVNIYVDRVWFGKLIPVNQYSGYDA